MKSSITLAALALLAVVLLFPGRMAAQSDQRGNESLRTQAVEQLVGLGLQIHENSLDCSHFVNSLFETIGLGYEYQPSRILYRGTEAFKRIYEPQTGDLVVWPGHVGIVVDPETKTFVSSLRTGVKVATYTSRYWKRRGHPRFFRYSLPVTPTITWEIGNESNSGISNKSGMD